MNEENEKLSIENQGDHHYAKDTVDHETKKYLLGL